MKFVILFALVAVACAAPAYDADDKEKEPPAEIVEEGRNLGEDGSYDFNFQGSDGSAREESASIDNKGTDEESLTITGSYRYIDADGNEVVVNYTAGKDGFVPVGTIIAKEISEVAAKAKDLPSQYEDDEQEQPRSSLNAPRQ